MIVGVNRIENRLERDVQDVGEILGGNFVYEVYDYSMTCKQH